ncbi:MAG: septal ring lytic transglycosylase RlpA family protein [Alphaproteobacteria bacterium]|nr:septal ring lytic transglycosylase RlpA family protein [Alphaproteobacteria bacterium]
MKRVCVALLSGVVLLGAGFVDAAMAKSVTGFASYYKSGRLTANGERFNPHGLTAAHRTLPFGTRVAVTNLKTGKSVVVRINDRGPFVRNRVIDLSLGAAKAVGLVKSGVARVKVTILD